MPIYQLPEQHIFPPAFEAEPNGLLAVGGDLHPDRLFKAYQEGIFPWYSQRQPILWFSPNPRFVLFPSELHIPKTLKKTIKKKKFEIRINTDFFEVVKQCSEFSRPDQYGTWITNDMKNAYNELHRIGRSHSFEAFEDGVLVGGLYGVSIGGIFAGESMFAEVSDASKVAFIWAVRQLQLWGVQLIDCQVYTEHLERFGAREIPRMEYMQHLKALQVEQIEIGSTFDSGFFPV